MVNLNGYSLIFISFEVVVDLKTDSYHKFKTEKIGISRKK